MTKTLKVNYSGKDNDVVWDCTLDGEFYDKGGKPNGWAYGYKVLKFYDGTKTGGVERSLDGTLKHEAWVANSSEIQQWAKDNL